MACNFCGLKYVEYLTQRCMFELIHEYCLLKAMSGSVGLLNTFLWLIFNDGLINFFFFYIYTYKKNDEIVSIVNVCISYLLSIYHLVMKIFLDLLQSSFSFVSLLCRSAKENRDTFVKTSECQACGFISFCLWQIQSKRFHKGKVSKEDWNYLFL